jgi:hypothetical protein
MNDKDDGYLKVKSDWLAQKHNLQKRLIKENRVYETNARIIDMTIGKDGRERPSPRYKSQHILSKYNFIT